MKKNDALKKHHFWILLGLVPLLTLIGAMIVSSSVGGAIAERQKLLDDAKGKIGPKVSSAKPKSLLAKADDLVATVSSKQGGLHQTNWDRQKNLFTWPAGSQLLRDIEYGEANIEKAADRIIDVGLPPTLRGEQRTAKVKEVRDEMAKLTPLERNAKLKEMLDKLPITLAQRKAILEPAWPKFGDPLPNSRGEYDDFQRLYRSQFSTIKKDGTGGPGTGMADRIAPTQFYGGWERVLRHVTDFGAQQLTSDQVWLMMEDLWVERSFLDAVGSINAEMATFHRAIRKDGNVQIDPSFNEGGYKIRVDRSGKPVIDRRTRRPEMLPTPDDERRKALFANRTWAVELEMVRDGDTQRLTGTLTNLTDRLQLLGVGNIMTLNVWFKTSPQPFTFRIGGEYVPGKSNTPAKDAGQSNPPANVLRVVATPDHILPASLDANAELLRVEQVFDVRTVPVKRIDALAFGQTEALDARNAAATLLPPNPPFAKEPDAAAGTDTANMTGPPMSGAPTTAPGAPGALSPGGVPGLPGLPGSTGQTATSRSGGGPLVAVIDAHKKRYLIASSEVRRMPVGIVLVVDQSLIQDVLMAFANSPLRFQITQVEWTSFTGQLNGAGPAAGSTGEMGGIDFGSGTVNFGSGGLMSPGLRPNKGGVSVGIPGVGSGPPGVGVGPPGVGTGPPGVGVPPGLGVGMPGMPGMPEMSGGYGNPYNRPSTVSESQITSGLVELSIYGIVSLYEKYEPKVDPAAAAGGSTAPAITPTAPPTPTTPPTPTKPMPEQPAAPDTKTAPKKKRRRSRR